MSSRNICLSAPSPEIPSGGGTELSTTPGNPLDRMFQPSEDSDWEETFLSVIRPADASTPTPSSIRSDDNCEKKDKNLNKKHNLNTSENQPIELNETAQIIEIEVPVNSTITDGAFTPLWSHDSFSPNSPTYKSIPLHVAEGREDPNPDEGFNEPTSSPSKPQGPMASGLETNQEEALPETFFDDANFLQWVINDQDTSLPEFAEDQATSTTCMPPSQHATATTLSFITPLKTDQAPARRDLPATITSADLLATASTSATTMEVETIPTVAALPLAEIKEEDPEWTETEISGPSGSRKRGRPSLPPGRTITPHPSTLEASLTDDECSAQKFRRLRDLNNEASRRCRENRKLKAVEAEEELEKLAIRNIELRSIVAKMEKEATAMKAYAMRAMRGRKENSNPQGSKDPGDLASMWSAM